MRFGGNCVPGCCALEHKSLEMKDLQMVTATKVTLMRNGPSKILIVGRWILIGSPTLF